MVYIRQISCFITAVVFATAMIGTPVSALEKEQTNAIIQNCDDNISALKKLEHADSRTRTYLGSTYEAINGRFLTPLNLRLVKNNYPSSELFQIQNDFSSAQGDFRNNYVEYMRELESLISIDCIMEPQAFYKKLEVVREKRDNLRTDTKKLSELTSKLYATVKELQAKL